MSEYEHLKKQKDEMLAKHREPGTKCPFGCPHESEARLREELAAAKKKYHSEIYADRIRCESIVKLSVWHAEKERDEARAKLAAMEKVVEAAKLVRAGLAVNMESNKVLIRGPEHQEILGRISQLIFAVDALAALTPPAPEKAGEKREEGA